MQPRNIQIGIIGPEEKNIRGTWKRKETTLRLAAEIGRAVAREKAILITGGCSGVVEAACKGAYQAGGIVVGTPGRKRGSSIPWTTVEICTPLDVGDYLIAGILSCDVIIVIPGDAGTFAELAIAYRYKKPLIFIQGFEEKILTRLRFRGLLDYPYWIAQSAQEAVQLAMRAVKS